MYSLDSHNFNVGVAQHTRSLQAATLFNNILFWIRHNKANNINFINGHTWVFKTYQEFAQCMPYFEPYQIKDALKILVDYGYLIKDNFNPNKFDRTNWYALPHEEWLDNLQNIFPKRGNPIIEKNILNNEDSERKEDFSKNLFDKRKSSHRGSDILSSPYIYKEPKDKERKVGSHPLPAPPSSLLNYFLEKLKIYCPRDPSPTSSQKEKWDKSIQKILKKIPGASEEEIKGVIDFICSTKDEPGKNGFTWAANVRSGHALYQHYTKILDQMKGCKQAPVVQSTEKLERLKKIGDFLETALTPYFTSNIFFASKPTECEFNYGPKGWNKKYVYNDYNPEKLKEELRKDVCQMIPRAAEEIRWR